MKLSDIWQSREKPTLSFEIFPARSEKGEISLVKTVEILTNLQPDFISVTFGAGGSTQNGSRQLLEILKNKKNLEVLAYFACYGLSPSNIVSILDDYQALGIENILAVRGDKPRDENFVPHPSSLPHATDLINFIRKRYDYCLGVAGYPEGHIEALSQEKDLEYLKKKIDLGAEFVITNYFYDNKYFIDYVEKCRAAGIDLPIIPGIMPIYSVKMMKILANMCGATIIDDISEGIASLPENDSAALNEFGIEFAARQCAELIDFGVPGLHIYTMDRSHSASGVVARLRDAGYL